MSAKFSIILLFLCLTSFAIAQDLSNIDLDVLLNNKVYVETQMQCVNKKKPNVCDRIGTRMRDVILPDVAKHGTCNVCTPAEKIVLGKIARKIKTDYPADWEELIKIYKPAPEIIPTLLEKEMALAAAPK